MKPFIDFYAALQWLRAYHEARREHRVITILGV